MLTDCAWPCPKDENKGRVYVSIGLDNGLSPLRCQAIIWTNASFLLIGSLYRNTFQWNHNTTFFMQENKHENIVCKMSAILSQLQYVIDYYMTHVGMFCAWQTLLKLFTHSLFLGTRPAYVIQMDADVLVPNKTHARLSAISRWLECG